MHQLRRKHGKPLLLAEDSRCVSLADPVSSFRCLEEDLRALTHLTRLELTARRDEAGSLDFIGGLNSLQELLLHDMPELSDWSGILACGRLRKLEIGWRTKFDFRLPSRIKTLRSFLCVMCDEHQIAHLTEAGQLEEVVLRGGFKLENLHSFSRMSRIELLQLWSGRIRSTAGIGALHRLKDLNLGYSRLQEVTEIWKLPVLKRLQLVGNKAIRELNCVTCPSLECLEMLEIPRVASFQPLKCCQRLQKLLFAGQVEDGDLSPLLDLPALAEATLGGRYKSILTSARTRKDCAIDVGKFRLHLSPSGLKSISKRTIPGTDG